MDETACIFSLDALIYRFTIVTTVFPFSDHGLTRDGRVQVLSTVGSGDGNTTLIYVGFAC